ncbi:MAG: tyrosinase family protein [Acidimicrobiales bacterium]
MFFAQPSSPSSVSLALDLPEGGGWVDFWMGGKWGSPSTEDRDCLLVIGGAEPTEIPLMVRVRKNANTLTPGERDRFLKAWGAVNRAGRGAYQDFRDMHVDAANAQEHGGPHFLAWHRAYVLDLERVLQAVDPSVSMHYWRFDQPAPNLFRSNFIGATKVLPWINASNPPPSLPVVFDGANPLSQWVTDGTPGVLRTAIFDTQSSQAPGPPSRPPLLTQAQTMAIGSTYPLFGRVRNEGGVSKGIEANPHGWAHMSFSGYISSIPTAPKDPLFFLLHSNVDRLWALWQFLYRRIDPSDPDVYESQDIDGRRLGDTMWPWNGVTTPPRPNFAPRAAQGGIGGLAPSPVTPAPGNVPTVRSVIDYQGHSQPTDRIGYGYDVVPFEFSEGNP